MATGKERVTFPIRFTKEERRQLEANAARVNLTPADYIREVVKFLARAAVVAVKSSASEKKRTRRPLKKNKGRYLH